jgi:hypothetical protein
MERKKVSDQPADVWQKEFIDPLIIERKFKEITKNASGAAMRKDEKDGDMPPEYKNRKRHQGMQRKFVRYVNGRKIIVFSTWSDKIDGKKEGYLGYVFMEGQSIKGKFWSSPVNDTASFFEIMLEWVDAFVDLAEHWDRCDQGDHELTLMFTPGIMHMMKLECTHHDIHRKRRLSYRVIDARGIADKTRKFLKKKMIPSYNQQLKAKEENKILTFKRMSRSEKRKEARGSAGK